MRREENDCVSCPAGVPCLGRSCPMTHVEHIYCDNCGDEIDPDYVIESEGCDYCYECASELGLLEEEEEDE